jgi:hypothetical protein
MGVTDAQSVREWMIPEGVEIGRKVFLYSSLRLGAADRSCAVQSTTAGIECHNRFPRARDGSCHIGFPKPI